MSTVRLFSFFLLKLASCIRRFSLLFVEKTLVISIGYENLSEPSVLIFVRVRSRPVLVRKDQ